MHYKNGREAQEGDAVIFFDTYRKKVKVGYIWSIVEGSTSCNCQVAQLVPGGATHESKTIGDLYHADDVYTVMENFMVERNKVQEEAEKPKESNDA